MDMAMMFKPAPLVVKRKGDPEQLAKDWGDYVKVFREFLTATGVAGDYAQPEGAQPCPACVMCKSMIRLVGGDEVRTLFNHVGDIRDTDKWEETIQKITDGIKKHKTRQPHDSN